MAASNSTPIQLYYSNTSGSVPANTNLIIGELAINVPDGIIFYKDSSNTVNVIARTSAAAGRFPNVTFGDGSIQYTAGASWNYVNAINAMVNTAITDIIYLQGVDAYQNSVTINTQTYANGAYIRANAAFDKANSDYTNYILPAYTATQSQGGVDASQNAAILNAATFANGAFAKSNTNATSITNIEGVNLGQNTFITNVGVFANGAFDAANTNAIGIDELRGVDLTQNTSISLSWGHANAAFAYANTIALSGGSIDALARNHANSAYDQANTNALVIDALQDVDLTQNTSIQSAFDAANTNATNITALQGVNLLQNTNITLVSSYANGAFTKANTNATNITAIEGVNLVQNTSIQAAFDAANTNATNITNIQGVDLVQNTNITLVASYANSAYTKANNALANTTDITVANNFTVPGRANVYNSLSVGTGSYQVLPNLIAQFTGSSDLYSQINQQNLRANGSGDIVITADNGTDTVNFIDMGLAGSTYDNSTFNAYPFSQPNDGWLFLVGNTASSYGGNLTLGTAGSGGFADISFVQGQNYDEIARFKYNANVEFYRPVVANSFTTSSGIDVITYTNTANTYLKNIIDTKVSKSGDSITGSLSITDTSSANALSVTGNVFISNDLRISGNLYIGGNATSVSANNLTLDDSIIYLANNNNTNTIDIGIVGAFNDGTYQHTGFVRDANDGKWKLFSNVVSEPSTTVDFTNAVYDTLKLGTVEANAITISGLNIATHANLAFDKANSAYVLANNRVATVSGTSGRITSSGTTDITIDLATTGVTGGTYTYPSLVVDSYGRVASISSQTPVTTFNTRTGAVTLNSGDVTGALGFTPVDSSTYSTDLTNQSGVDAYQNTNVTLTGSYANSAYIKANNVGNYANSAYGRANAAYTYATNAGDYANGAFAQANTTAETLVLVQGELTSSFETANLGYSYSVSAYARANNSGIYANGAFSKANTAQLYATNAGNFANGAFEKANTVGDAVTVLQADLISAYDTANLGYGQANTGTILASSAFGRANNAGVFANGAFSKANTVNILASSAFDVANNVGIYANSAFEMANAAYQIGGGVAGVFANGAFAQANAAYILANASFDTVNTNATLTTSAFAKANSSYDYAVNSGSFANGAFTQANLAFDAANTAYQLGGVLVGTYANGAFERANSAFGQSNAVYVLADNAYGHANLTYDITQAAFARANNAGVFANGAFAKSNTTNILATSAFDYANSVGILTTSAYGQANTTNILATAAYGKANSAGDVADTALATGLLAYGQANTATTDAGNAYTLANNAYNYAYPAYNNTLDLAGVNLVQNTNVTLVASYANSAYTKANTATTDAGIAGSYANSAFGLANTNAQTLALEQSFSNAAFSLANTNATNISNIQGVDSYQNTQISSTLTLVNAAFAVANNEVVGNQALVLANAAFGTANTNAGAITVIQGVDSYQNTQITNVTSTAGGAFTKANDAYVLANSAYAYANTLVTGGTSIDGWARGHANAAYDTANAAFGTTNTSIALATGAYNKANSIVAPTYHTGETPPDNPSTSAIWYKTDADIMYQWITADGTNYYWIDIGSPTVTVGNTVISYTYTGYGRAAAHAMIFGGF